MKKVMLLFASAIFSIVIFSSLFVGKVYANENHANVKNIPIHSNDFLINSSSLNTEVGIEILPQETNLAVGLACSHPSFSAWTTINSRYERSPNAAACFILVQYQMRYCLTCNAAYAREVKSQTSHIWTDLNGYRKVCERCGMEAYYLKS